MMVLQVAFWFLIFLIVYIYFGYPVLLKIISSFKKVPSNEGQTFKPKVTFFIAAYNEEKVIGEKLQNAVGLNYPRELLEIIVVSDDSSDRTNEIVEEYSTKYPFITLNVVKGRKGKTEALNKSVPLAKGDVLVFSDANSMYEKDALLYLVKHFSEPSIGGVCGELKLLNSTNSSIGESEGAYWKYEKLLKTLETQTGTSIVANGSIYAIRRELFKEMNPNVGDDMQNPLIIISQGKRFVYEPNAITKEETSTKEKEEFGRKVRIVTRSFTGIMAYKKVLNPFKNFDFFYKYMSHKFLRWLVPYYMIAVFIMNLFLLEHELYKWVFAAQLLFYGLAVLGIWVKHKITYIPYYFCLVNYAALLGTMRAMTGKRQATWKPTSR
ncbi:glycosyltransferase family 2 protein [Mesobacillus selenatarsenatis]|uniref:Glycosyl transferase, group 2 family protein n=1 Tax=Mesobacillus selenatarsenatis (strain DSM 18680 / JCM 14380 / FERM P-15431 / SF-1) TaxID=1321606 RepID=A0A0A8X1K2_MESS1|nr:glycosyltransferase family 2 protein [Mesobacillus selenatarsenatis]GAM12011.1 glycosyl transferase, group 2 family protein [Mesobacillus selenatarsenatis SF-1]